MAAKKQLIAFQTVSLGLSYQVQHPKKEKDIESDKC